MFQVAAIKSILIVEPNLQLEAPYSFLNDDRYQITRVSNVLDANTNLKEQDFALVFLSCSFSNKKLINFLESLKEASHKKIIPLILLVDLNQPYSIVPGLNWNQQLALLSSNSSKKELMGTLSRFF